MKKIVIIADDLTGALDATAPFASPSVSAKVTLGPCDPAALTSVDVLSSCIETRHMALVQARDAVRAALASAREAGAQILFKKTDSALRGNVGAELEALLQASGAQVVHFIPAFPEAGRTTEYGVHLVDGVPVAESSFGTDPLNPVSCSRVADIIAVQSAVPVLEVSLGATVPSGFRGIAVYDAATQEDIDIRAAQILSQDGVLAVAGSAGLSRALAARMGIQGSRSIEGRASSLLVMCGSGNPASRAQCAAARQAAFGIDVPLAAMTDPLWLGRADACQFARDVASICDPASPLALVDASAPVPASVGAELALDDDALRSRISEQLGALFARLTCDLQPSAAMVMGGDALAAYLRALRIDALAPFAEPAPGVVASYVDAGRRRMVLISKSGGFGGPQLFCELAERLSGRPLAARAVA